MIRITLDDTTRDQLKALRRTGLAPKVRDRIEMVTLSDAGWSPPRIAAHLGCHPQTVRDTLRGFLARGTAALYPFRSGPAPDVERRGRVDGSLRELLGEDRTWTGRQLSRALAGRGISMGPRQVRRHLKRLGARYRRTASAPEHEQGPVKAERAGRVPPDLRARAASGRLELYYLDGCGSAPTLPVGPSRGLPGPREPVRYEAPRGRRVDALAAYRPSGRSPRPEAFTAERAWDSCDLLGSPTALPWSKVPRAVVPDSAGIHTSRVIRQARRSLCERGIYLDYLPPHSPELDRVEAVSRRVKYQGMPRRSFTSRSALREAVELGFGDFARALQAKCPQPLRPAA